MKKYTAILMILFVVTLTGCSAQSVALTDEESNMIAEYMAGTLLKYDKNYAGKLITAPEPEPSAAELESDSIESDSPEAVTADSQETASAIPVSDVQEKKSYTDLKSLYTDSAFELSYRGYNLYDSYPKSPESFEFKLEPLTGKKLFVVEFEIKNVTDKKKKLNLPDAGLSYKLLVDDASLYNASITPLLNDLQYLDASVGAKSSKDAVIVFEVDRELKFNTVNLYVTASDKTAEIKIK